MDSHLAMTMKLIEDIGPDLTPEDILKKVNFKERLDQILMEGIVEVIRKALDEKIRQLELEIGPELEKIEKVIASWQVAPKDSGIGEGAKVQEAEQPPTPTPTCQVPPAALVGETPKQSRTGEAAKFKEAEQSATPKCQAKRTLTEPVPAPVVQPPATKNKSNVKLSKGQGPRRTLPPRRGQQVVVTPDKPTVHATLIAPKMISNEWCQTEEDDKDERVKKYVESNKTVKYFPEI